MRSWQVGGRDCGGGCSTEKKKMICKSYKGKKKCSYGNKADIGVILANETTFVNTDFAHLE